MVQGYKVGEAIGKEGVEASDRLALLPLTPNYQHADHGIYFNVLESALTGEYRKIIRNIALTGGYGVGKSSILQKVAQEHSNTVVQISLSTLGPSHELTEGDPPQTIGLSKTNRIQKEIVKQLLYREDPTKTPGSRFRRIGRFKFWRELWIALLAGFVIALVFYLTGWTVQLAELARPYFEPSIITQAVVLVGASVSVLAMRALSHNRIRIEKVSAGAATVSLSQESTSFFDQYLDEIVYFFDATRHDIVIFEDIDRFDDPHIFETLRALNTLLNGAKQLRGRNIRFIYAIKDSIFDELGARGAREEGVMDSTDPDDAAQLAVARANRTKFFDLVIPVVPFITHRSARDLMTKLMGGLEQQVSPELVDLAARHVADMRLIKNIRNEFVIFSQKVMGPDGLGLDLNADSLFAMILYKSTHLSDFEDVRTGNSKLDALYQAGRELVSQNIARLNAEARVARQQLSKLESVAKRSTALADGLIEYTDRVVRHAGGTVLSITFDGAVIDPDQFKRPNFWEKLVSSDGALILNIRTSQGYPTTLTFSRADLSQALGDPLSLPEWQDGDRASLQEQLDVILEQRKLLAHADMHDLMDSEQFTVKSTDGNARSFRQLANEYLDSKLACQLIEAGHINRDFTLYTSTFYTDRVSSQATNFIMHNVDSNVMDVHFELTDDDVQALIRERGTSTLRERAMYNISVLDYLLRANAPDADLLVTSLKSYGEDQQRFLQAYLADGSQQDALIRKLAGWPRIFTFVVSEAAVDDTDRVRLLNVALESMAEDVRYMVDDQFRDYLEANYTKLLVMTSTSTGGETAARIADLLAAADVKLASLAPLADNTRPAVAAQSRYVVTRDNLVLALNGLEELALDLIHGRDPVVYKHVLSNLVSYVAEFGGDETWPHTVRANAAFTDILAAVLGEDNSQLDSIVAAASPECRVLDVATVSEVAWPVLAKYRRFPITLGNVKAYIDELGGIDDHLAGYIAAAQTIDATGTDPAARSRLGAQLLAARDALPEPEVRVDLVMSLELEDWLPAASVEPERGQLIGLLIENRVIADNAESFALTRVTNWPTREFAINRSAKFASFMTPIEVPIEDLTLLLRSDLVSPTVKSVIVDRFSEFTVSADRATLTAVAEYALQIGRRLKFEDVSRLARERISSSLVVDLLEPLLAELTVPDLTPIFSLLGGDYPQVGERNGKRPSLPDTPGDRALVQRLEQLGTVSSSGESGGMLRVNMRRK